MLISVKNQRPCVLDCNQTIPVKGDFHPEEYLNKAIVKPVFTPMTSASPTTITLIDDAGNANLVDEQTFMGWLAACTFDEDFHDFEERATKDVLARCMVHFDISDTMNVDSLFVTQAAKQEKLPMPTPAVKYTINTDVLPAAKGFLAGSSSFELWFASLALYAHPNTFGVSVQDEDAFNAFKEYVANQAANLGNVLPPETVQRLQDFNQQTNLSGLTESLLLRTDYTNGNDEFSFARLLPYFVCEYAKQPANGLALMPFSISQMAIPKSIVFVNVDAHAHSTAPQIADEWKIINNAIVRPPLVVPTGKIAKLTAAARAAKKASRSAAANAMSNSQAKLAKASQVRFRKTPPTTTDLLRSVRRVMAGMAQVARSQNSYKKVKMSFARPNRRDPDDFNRQGKVVSTRYKPDIHLYLDTSGSISERNYQDMVLACIRLARKLNVNLYFNSFSHVLSQCTYLPVKGRSTKQIYHQFQKVPKVTGGTNYAQIWDYIEQSPKRQRELSIIMTDMEYTAPREHHTHPKNLYYVPCSHMDWDHMVHYAQQFINSAKHIEPAIRKHLLM